MISDLLSREDRITADQFGKSFKVTAIAPHPFASGAVRVRIECTHAGVHRALKHHETRDRKYLHRANSGVSPRFLFSEIVFEIDSRGYVPLDMKFLVDAMAALKLLTGNRLYSDKRVFLRELVQNAVDACNLNKLYQSAYEPKISIEFDSGYETLRFRDNGIGFLSSFLAADRIVIRTRKQGSPGLVITINTLQDYFDVRFASDDCPGAPRSPSFWIRATGLFPGAWTMSAT